LSACHSSGNSDHASAGGLSAFPSRSYRWDKTRKPLGGLLLRLTTLGAIDLRDRRGHPLREILGQPKRIALLVYLALESSRLGGRVSRDRLLALFWPESDAGHARNALSQALHHLRQALGTDVIESRGATVVGVRADQVWCDATIFLETLERGDVELALDLYRGEFCPTLFTNGAPELEQWLDARRRELRERALVAARKAAEQLAERGDAAGAVRAARRALALRPDDEADVRAMLVLLERAGDVASALSAYQDYVKWLHAELDTEPAPQTARLVEAMRQRRERDSGAAVAVTDQADTPPPQPSPISRPVLPRREWRLRPALLASAALALLTLSGAIAYDRREGRANPANKMIAVFPFAVHGGERHDYLREGMVDLLSAKLDGAVGLRAVDPRSAIASVRAESASTRDAAALARAARRLGAGWYVTGDAVPVGGRLQINGALHDVSGDPQALATASVSGDSTNLFELVDDLTGRLLASLTGGRDTALTRLAAVTTRSLPALKAFLEGERNVRAGRDAQAAAAFRDATQLDTTFALAQYRLAIMSTWISVRDAQSVKTASAVAARHAEHLTPLVRDLLAAYSAYQYPRPDEAERMYRMLSESHPENVEAWMMLGETLFHFNWTRGRSAGESRSAFERVLSLDSTNAHAVIHLARLAASEGRINDLDDLARHYFALHQEADRVLEMRALQAYAHDDPVLRASIAAEYQQTDEFVRASILQDVLVYAHSLNRGAELAGPYTRAAAAPMVRFSQRMLSDLALARGRFGRAAAAEVVGSGIDPDWLAETAALVAADPFFPLPRAEVTAQRDSVATRRPYAMQTSITRVPAVDLGSTIRAYLLGLLSVRLGDTADANRHLGELSARRDDESVAVSAALTHGLRAELARARGDFRRALVELEAFHAASAETAWYPLGHWGQHERFLHGEVLLALGRDDEALPWYDTFTLFDLPYFAPADLRRGEIYERQGNRARARFYFGRAALIWEGCDVEFQPLLARARDGLRRVSSDQAAPSHASRES